MNGAKEGIDPGMAKPCKCNRARVRRLNSKTSGGEEGILSPINHMPLKPLTINNI
jgi:hypothetical protein